MGSTPVGSTLRPRTVDEVALSPAELAHKRQSAPGFSLACIQGLQFAADIAKSELHAKLDCAIQRGPDGLIKTGCHAADAARIFG